MGVLRFSDVARAKCWRGVFVPGLAAFVVKAQPATRNDQCDASKPTPAQAARFDQRP
jgi:hypothetical protein